MEILYKLMHLGAFVKNQLVVSIWVKFWIFYSVPLTCKLVFIPMTCCFNYYSFVEMEYLDAFLVRKLSVSVSSSSEVDCCIDCFLNCEGYRHALQDPDFTWAHGDPNAGPHVCIIRASLTEPSLQLSNFHFKNLFWL